MNGISLKLILAIPFCSIIIACLWVWLTKKYAGGAVSALISRGANSPETAVALKTLGFNGFFARLVLRASGALSAISQMSACNPDEKRSLGRRAARPDILAMRSYIPESSRLKAEKLYAGKRFPFILLIAIILLAAVVFTVLYFVLPLALDLEGLGIRL